MENNMIKKQYNLLKKFNKFLNETIESIECDMYNSTAVHNLYCLIDAYYEEESENNTKTLQESDDDMFNNKIIKQVLGEDSDTEDPPTVESKSYEYCGDNRLYKPTYDTKKYVDKFYENTFKY